jgi:hypothetical protein
MSLDRRAAGGLLAPGRQSRDTHSTTSMNISWPSKPLSYSGKTSKRVDRAGSGHASGGRGVDCGSVRPCDRAFRFCARKFSGLPEIDFRLSRCCKKSVGHAPKKNPEADYAPGFQVCCLTRLLGPGGGCRGMEAARSGLFVNLRTQRPVQRSSVRQCGGCDRFRSNHPPLEAEAPNTRRS